MDGIIAYEKNVCKLYLYLISHDWILIVHTFNRENYFSQ